MKYLKMFIAILPIILLSGCIKSANLDNQEKNTVSESHNNNIEEDLTLIEPIETNKEKEIPDTFLYTLYYEEWDIPVEEYWGSLITACTEAIEENKWEEFSEEYAATYHIMTSAEKEDYAYRDESGVLDCYMLEREKEDEWFLVSSRQQTADIVIKVPSEEYKGLYLYYMFVANWQHEDGSIYYNKAVSTLGSDECYFLEYEDEFYIVLFERTEEGKLKGLSVHEYGHQIYQTILYFKIINENQVEKILLYNANDGGMQGAASGSKWPVYPE